MTEEERSPSGHGLFEVFGVEIEYMIVARDSLDVRPIADRLLRDESGTPISELERGPFAWSNELVLHVVEIKTNGPASSLEPLAAGFHAEVSTILDELGGQGAILLPGGAHPWMDPGAETKLWPHEYEEIYRLYDRTFGCARHGWANLQSVHLNLPFASDEEFGRLHAAVRAILPLLPALAAASPVLDGRRAGFKDARLEVYRHNQESIPVITGLVIPERAFTERTYRERILDPLAVAIRPFDPEGIVPAWVLNSRGAIARFDRGSIEIRLIDTQESPRADLAIVETVVAVLRNLVEERWSGAESQMRAEEERLAAVLVEAIREAEDALIEDRGFLELLGCRKARMRAGAVWEHLAAEVEAELSEGAKAALAVILSDGTLASRLLRALPERLDRTALREAWGSMAAALRENELLR